MISGMASRFVQVQYLKGLQVDDIAQWPLRSQVMLVTLLFIIGQMIVIPFILSPQFYELNAIKRQKEEIRHSIKIKEEQLLKLPSFRQAIEDRNADLAKYLNYFPHLKDLPNVLTAISQIGSENGVDIIEIYWGEKQTHSFLSILPINIEMVGEYHDIVFFTELITHLPKLVVPHQIKINRSSQSKKRLQVYIKALTYQLNKRGEKEGGNNE